MNPACQLHGAGLNRIQDFLLRSLQPSTITKYTQALNRLSSDLAEQGLSWHEMSEEQKDYFLAEWLLDAFEDGKEKAEYGWALSAVQKIFPRLHLKVAWRVFDAWGQLHASTSPRCFS